MTSTETAPAFAAVTTFFRSLTQAKRPEPSYPKLPEVRDSGESNVRGLYLAGDVAGTPLVKLSLNQGVDVMDRIHDELGSDQASGDMADVLIVGAGPAGLGAALRAKELGRTAVVLEAERMAMTVQNMFEGKQIFAEPFAAQSKSKMWLQECTREELLEKWEAQVKEEALDVRTFEKVTNVQRNGDHFVVESDKGTYTAKRVVLAIGKSGNPRKAGVPGEQEFAARVQHNLSAPSSHKDQDLFVYGGGDVACEAAIALATRNTGADANRVTLVTIDESFVYPKKRNADRVLELAKEGRIDLYFNHELARIEDGAESSSSRSRGAESSSSRSRGAESSSSRSRGAESSSSRSTGAVVFKNRTTGEEVEKANDVVFEMIGATLPLAFFDKVGIRLAGTWTPLRIAAVALSFLLVYSLYALKKFPEQPYSWPFHLFFSVEGFSATMRVAFDIGFAPFAWMFEASAYETMRKTLWFQQGYLYSLLYTLIMIGFGLEALRRWSNINAGKPEEKRRYQKYRYASLITFQVVFFLIANVFAVQALSVDNAWRAWGLYQPWPLFFNTFHWWDLSNTTAVLWFFISAGVFGTVVAIPLASRMHGKRFCTWVCGCGGLAETLGDRWRHLAAKGRRSRAWEFQGVVVLLGALLCTVITVGAFGTRANNGWAMTYSYIVDFWLVAVIPIALYPFFGGKVWCRFWCPLAAYNGLLAKWYGRLRIKSNDKCISCTQCSKYCQVGVDVMSFAKNQADFDNGNSACIQCGICIDVCPMDVLSFDSSPREKLKVL